MPGPMSRTTPEAVLRRGGISAVEFRTLVGLNSSESVVVGGVAGWDGVSGRR